MTDKDGEDKNLKFEEDIKSPVFLSLYSFSNKRKIKSSKKLNKLNDPARLFPDLKKRLGDDYDGNKKIKIVNGLKVIERVIEGASFLIDDDDQLECKCALVVWYKKESSEKPVVVEFSFKYKKDNKEETFSGKAAHKAYSVFQKLREDKNLKSWVDLESLTKTRFVYEYSDWSLFC